MAKNRTSQSASIRFGPSLTALCLCLLIAGAAIGYVWQKSQVGRLGVQIRDLESQLGRQKAATERLTIQLNDLSSTVKLVQRARSLGLVPQQPGQMVWLAEPSFAVPAGPAALRPLAARSVDGRPQ
jgi:hypothetical protein